MRRAAAIVTATLLATGCSLVIGLESSYDLKPDGVVEAGSAQPISDAGSCDGGPCKECVPGDFRCTGVSLERCVGGRFEPFLTCDTAERCSATGGNCDGLYCLPGQHRCRGDELEKCNGASTAFEQVASCGVGLCDALSKRCNVCVPYAIGCRDDGTRKTCNADGLTELDEPCPASAPRCAPRAGGAACVECIDVSQCSLTGACRKPACVNGQCSLLPDLTKNGQIVTPQQQGQCTHVVCTDGSPLPKALPVGTFCDRDQYGNSYSCRADGGCISNGDG